jgi:hypothetical protein
LTLRIRYHLAAAEEQDDVAAYYARLDPGLGADFLARLRATRAAMAKHPESFALVQGHAEIRRAPLDRFPYRLIYAVNADELFVLAVAHERRLPGYWEGRLAD